MARESSTEKYLIREIERLGGKCIKLIGYVGIPDRMVLLPGGRIIFVELKTEKGKQSKAQEIWEEKLTKLGFEVVVPKGFKEVKQLVDTLK